MREKKREKEKERKRERERERKKREKKEREKLITRRVHTRSQTLKTHLFMQNIQMYNLTEIVRKKNAKANKRN